MHYTRAVKTCIHKHLSHAETAACRFLSTCSQAKKEAIEVMKTLFYLIIRIRLHIL